MPLRSCPKLGPYDRKTITSALQEAQTPIAELIRYTKRQKGARSTSMNAQRGPIEKSPNLKSIGYKRDIHQAPEKGARSTSMNTPNGGDRAITKLEDHRVQEGHR